VGVNDVWVEMGSKEEVQYTWDMEKIANLEGCGRSPVAGLTLHEVW
jgi:hypothetical protein